MKRIGLFFLAVVMVAGSAGCNGGGDDPQLELIGETTLTWAGTFYSGWKRWDVAITSQNNSGDPLELFWWSNRFQGDNGYSKFEEGAIKKGFVVPPNGSVQGRYSYYARPKSFSRATVNTRFLARNQTTGEVVSADFTVTLIDPAY